MAVQASVGKRIVFDITEQVRNPTAGWLGALTALTYTFPGQELRREK
jgi:hypothetical protein